MKKIQPEYTQIYRTADGKEFSDLGLLKQYIAQQPLRAALSATLECPFETRDAMVNAIIATIDEVKNGGAKKKGGARKPRTPRATNAAELPAAPKPPEAVAAPAAPAESTPPTKAKKAKAEPKAKAAPAAEAPARILVIKGPRGAGFVDKCIGLLKAAKANKKTVLAEVEALSASQEIKDAILTSYGYLAAPAAPAPTPEPAAAPAAPTLVAPPIPPRPPVMPAPPPIPSGIVPPVRPPAIPPRAGA